MRASGRGLESNTERYFFCCCLFFQLVIVPARVHASGLRRDFQPRRALLGLPVPRLAVHRRRRGDPGTGVQEAAQHEPSAVVTRPSSNEHPALLDAVNVFDLRAPRGWRCWGVTSTRATERPEPAGSVASSPEFLVHLLFLNPVFVLIVACCVHIPTPSSK